MRERIARALSALALITLVGLAGAFARAQNPARAGTDGGPSVGANPSPAAPTVPGAPEAGPPLPAPAPPEPAADSARGRALFEEQGCVMCHSAAGVGSPRIPLDGVGARRSRASLRAWTTGDPALADSLAPATLRRKQGYTALPEPDLRALTEFLASLR
jgi:hypothetical protein